MARPCKNDHEYSPSTCRICQWISVSDKHRKYWGEESLPKVEVPSIVQQAINLARATAQHLVTGLKVVDEETKRSRLAICHDCEFFNRETTTCHRCGCKMSIKAGWQEQRCPVSKW